MSNADVVIAALRGVYDNLAGRVSGLTDGQLAGPTAAAEWDVSQVLSHLGSGAEISQHTLQVSLEGKPNPGLEFNKGVWARYDNASRRERLEWFLSANEALTQSYESLNEATRESLRIDLGFLPAPVDVAAAGSFRLNELAFHAWDVLVSFDQDATVAPQAVPLLLPVVGNLAGFLGKPEALNSRELTVAVTTADPAAALTLRLAQPVAVSDGAPEAADGTLSLPAESWLRLVTGRLKPPYIPVGKITTTGEADLDLIRRVFPKF